jgi:serine protease Do
MDLRNAMLAYAPGTSVDIEYVRNGSIQKSSLKLKVYQAQTMPTTPSPFGGRRPRSGGDNPFEQFNIPGVGKDGNPFDQGDEPAKPEERKIGEPAHLGVQIADVDESVRSQFGLPKTATGVVIVSVERGSIAASLGIKPGDVIENIDGKAVADGKSLKDAMSGVKWGDKRRIKTVRYSDGARMETTRDVLFK